MNPVLIQTSPDSIVSAKAALNDKVQLFQNVYNALKTLSVTPTLQDISTLIAYTIGTNAVAGFELNYVVEKMLDAAAPYNLNGVQLQRTKVKEMIVPPNVTGLKAALSAARDLPAGEFNYSVAYLTLANDVVSKVNNSDALIEALYTHYTKTDASATLANRLQAICDVLNAYNTDYDNCIRVNFQETERNYRALRGESIMPLYNKAIPGIDLTNGFKISLNYIRAFEASHPA